MGQYNFANIIVYITYYGGYIADPVIFNKLVSLGYQFSK